MSVIIATPGGKVLDKNPKAAGNTKAAEGGKP